MHLKTKNYRLGKQLFELSKLKKFADDNLCIAQMASLRKKVENILGEGENAGDQFTPFPKMFQKLFSSTHSQTT